MSAHLAAASPPRHCAHSRAESAKVPLRPDARPPKTRSGSRPSPCDGARTVRVRQLLVNPRSGLFAIPTRRPAIPSLGEHAGEPRSEEHTSELQSQSNIVCRLLLEKKKT